MSVRREVNEPIGSFNNRFHRAYTRLQDSYLHNDITNLPVYYATLDNLTSALVKMMQPPPASLVAAYKKAVVASADLGQNISSSLPSLGPIAHLMQIQGLNQAFAHQTPLMNQVPQLPIVPHPGQPLNYMPPTPSYLQPQQQYNYSHAAPQQQSYSQQPQAPLYLSGPEFPPAYQNQPAAPPAFL